MIFTLYGWLRKFLDGFLELESPERQQTSFRVLVLAFHRVDWVLEETKIFGNLVEGIEVEHPLYDFGRDELPVLQGGLDHHRLHKLK